MPLKNLSPSIENFEDLEYIDNPNINDKSYLAVFLVTSLSGRVFGDSSIADQLEAFLMAAEMAWGKRYSFALPF